MNPYVGGASGPAAAPPAPGSSSQPGSKQSEGPDGANLFIYHIPAGETAIPRYHILLMRDCGLLLLGPSSYIPTEFVEID